MAKHVHTIFAFLAKKLPHPFRGARKLQKCLAAKSHKRLE